MRTLVMLLLAPAAALAAPISWDAPVTVSGSNPALVADPDGGVHVVTSGSGVRYVRLSPTSDVLVDEEVPGAGNATSGFGFGPGLALDGALHVVWAVSHGDSVYSAWYSRKEGGWTAPLEVQGPTLRGYAPSVAASGVAHVVVSAVPDGYETPFGVANYVRISGGAVVDAKTIGEVRVDDFATITASGAVVHALFGYPSPGGFIGQARSTDGGQEFVSGPELQHGECGGRVGQPSLVNLGAEAHAAYGCEKDASAGDGPSVRYARLVDGLHVQDSRVTPPGAQQPWHLTLGIGRVAVAGQTRVVAWATRDEDADVSVQVSEDGAVWSAPDLVDQGCGGAEGRNAIALAAGGGSVWLACPSKNTRLHRGTLTQTPAPACDPPIRAISLFPEAATGSGATFEATYEHCEGGGAFRIVQLRVADVVAADVPAVDVSYEDGMLHLGDQSCPPGQGALSTPLATLDCAASTVLADGLRLTLRAAITFDPSFAGTHGVFFDAKGGSGTPEPRLNWTPMGTFTVVTADPGGDAGPAPGPDAVAPEPDTAAAQDARSTTGPGDVEPGGDVAGAPGAPPGGAQGASGGGFVAQGPPPKTVETTAEGCGAPAPLSWWAPGVLVVLLRRRGRAGGDG
ncbi:MAG: hypothetical protein AMXMBFR64_46890 [Myxococcales bacterium]